MSNTKIKRSRFIELLIQQVIATCEHEGNLFGGTTDEQNEVMRLIKQYDIETGRETDYIWHGDDFESLPYTGIYKSYVLAEDKTGEKLDEE